LGFARAETLLLSAHCPLSLGQRTRMLLQTLDLAGTVRLEVLLVRGPVRERTELGAKIVEPTRALLELGFARIEALLLFAHCPLSLGQRTRMLLQTLDLAGA